MALGRACSGPKANILVKASPPGDAGNCAKYYHAKPFCPAYYTAPLRGGKPKPVMSRRMSRASGSNHSFVLWKAQVIASQLFIIVGVALK